MYAKYNECVLAVAAAAAVAAKSKLYVTSIDRREIPCKAFYIDKIDEHRHARSSPHKHRKFIQLILYACMHRHRHRRRGSPAIPNLINNKKLVRQPKL